jgi:hypothetical protein
VRFAGRRETEIAADLAALLRKHGHSEVDFTVVGSGPNGANPHHEMGERVIEEGDMVVLDFGGIKDGYGSASMVRSGAWRRRSARSWRRPIEPKVRGANPLGRATRLGRSYAFAGTSLWPRTTRVRRSEARERFWPTSGGFLASSSDDLRARC